MVLDIKVEGDSHDSLSEEGAVVGEEVVGALDSDDEGVDVLALDFLDLKVSLRDVDQSLVNFLGRDEGCKGKEQEKKRVHVSDSQLHMGDMVQKWGRWVRNKSGVAIASILTSKAQEDCGKREKFHDGCALCVRVRVRMDGGR